jgi:hypothetical protein
MKLTRSQKRLIVLGIGILFIGFGILQAFFKFKVNQPVVDWVSFFLLVGAMMLLFGKDQSQPAKPENHPPDQSVSQEDASKSE